MLLPCAEYALLLVHDHRQIHVAAHLHQLPDQPVLHRGKARKSIKADYAVL